MRVVWKMTEIILRKMRNPRFEISFESGFSDGNHCLKLSCSSSKDIYSFQLNCDEKDLTLAFDFKELFMIQLVKFFGSSSGKKF